jgi:nitrogenase molybdenum-iron protein NifN
MVHVSTPSYSGTHMDGFHAAVRVVIETLAVGGPRSRRVNLFPGMVSAADLRYLKEVLSGFNLLHTLLPDYSDSLDGPSWGEYHKLPEGGTPLDAIRAGGSAQVSIEFGRTLAEKSTAGTCLEEKFSVPRRLLGLPIGIRESDAFFKLLEIVSGHTLPVRHEAERGRLVDAMIDGHKYVARKKAVVYGEEDLVVGLAAFLAEIGVEPVICASGGRSGRLIESIQAVAPELAAGCRIMSGVDFMDIAEAAAAAKPDFMLGSSKGYSLARKLQIPLVRVGFPIHDRIGGQRVLHLGYRGAQQLYDRIVNTLLEHKQELSHVGYSYL